jgi:hypothetical protein
MAVRLPQESRIKKEGVLMNTKALVLALMIGFIGIGGKYYQTKAEATQAPVKLQILESVASHTAGDYDIEDIKVKTVEVDDTEWTEELIMMNAIIEVKVDKVESVYMMEPAEMKDFAYEVGKEVNLGETLRALPFLESSFGKSRFGELGGRIGDNGESRGVTQIQIKTAKYILGKLMPYPNIKFSDEEIKMLLTKNDRVCIIMSKYYLVYLMDKFADKEANWSRGLLSYNTGPKMVYRHGTNWDPNNYVAKAKKFIKRERGS